MLGVKSAECWSTKCNSLWERVTCSQIHTTVTNFFSTTDRIVEIRVAGPNGVTTVRTLTDRYINAAENISHIG